MNQTENILIFIILSFVLAIILITKKDTIPPRIKRTLAIFAIAFMLLSFGLIVYSAFSLGS
ncbi:hypothetical protein NV379_14565 [Paenibacillus sp. N1-5-1-14]|uniref:hypothetical protein n=1 Tax=Paenibacillus radicibacter TaxID=2972488 RepID=UPI0021597F64|nr:hypothetical protein [Paenibacillus radicibacter]MCR8643876.1 hypothetical protein [Paenibacillus radicibacter]